MRSSVSERVALLLTHFFALNAVIQKILNGEKKTFILCVYRPEEGLWRHKLTQFDGIN